MPRIAQTVAPGLVEPTIQEIQRMRFAQQLRNQGAQTGPVASTMEGLARVVQGGIGGYMQQEQEQAQQERQRALSADLAALVGGAQGRQRMDPGVAPWQNPDTGQQWQGQGGLPGMLAAPMQSDQGKAMQTQMALSQALQEPGEGYTLGKDQVRYDAQGREVARGVESVQEAKPPGKYVPDGNGGWKLNPLAVEYANATRPPDPVAGLARLIGDEKLEALRLKNQAAQAAAEDRLASIEATKKKADDAARSTRNKGGIVLEDITRAKKLVNESPRLTTGFFGNILKDWAGSDAADVAALADTIGASISFESLNEMRRNSPTGGALGNVTEMELRLLKATLGSISQAQSSVQMLRNLDRLEKQYEAVVLYGLNADGTSKGPTELRSSAPGGAVTEPRKVGRFTIVEEDD